MLNAMKAAIAALLLFAPALWAVEHVISDTEQLSPAAIMDLWEDAEKAYDERDAELTIALFGILTQQNPKDPEGWFGLSVGYEWNGQHAEAAAAAERCQVLGFVFDSYMSMRLARLHARAGNTDDALRWIETSLSQGNRDRTSIASDDAFAGLYDNPRFVELTALPTETNMSRNEGLTFDLDYLISEAQRLHADTARPAFSAQFLDQAEQIRKDIPNLNDAEVLAGFMRLLATLDDGHTGLYGPDPDSPLTLNASMVPVKFYWFDEGVYVIDDATPEKKLLGQRVAKIGDLATEEVLTRLSKFRGVDNFMTWYWMGPQFYLGQIQMLQLVGATDSPDKVRLTMIDETGETTVQTVTGGDYNFPRKLRPLAGDDDVPLYLSRVDDSFWLESLDDGKTLYFQFNQVTNKDDESIEEFAKRLFTRLVEEKPGYLIVDVRHNNGGNNTLVQPLVKTIIAYEQANEANKIFIITGRNTFSASQNFINRIEQWTEAVFVGEPSASSPNFVGEETTLILPYSRVRGSISNRYWQDAQPYDQRLWIAPRLPVAPTAADYFAGRDAALEAVLEVISNDQDR